MKNKNKCQKCMGTGKEHTTCSKCHGTGELHMTDIITKTRPCPVPNCSNGKYAPTCRECKGIGCKACHNTGMALWNPEIKPEVTPESGTHVEGETHYVVRCKKCKGKGELRKYIKTPRRIVCPVCQGKKRVPVENALCSFCGGTGNKQCGNHIEIPNEVLAKLDG